MVDQSAARCQPRMAGRHYLFAALLLASCPVSSWAQGPSCAGGRVVLDANGDGVPGAREKGVPGVLVSDGRRVVRTDRHGSYRLHGSDDRLPFLIKPAGYQVVLRADGLPDTWGCKDFALRRDAAKTAAPLDLLVFGDPQPKSARDVEFYERDIVAPLRGSTRATLGITLGDLVNDVPSLYPALKRVDASLGLPWLHVPGNHDVEAAAVDDAGSLRTFHAQFGPDTYAWEETQASFVIMDDVILQPGQSPRYVGGLREDQFEFLAAYLAQARRDSLLVLSVHIPLFDTESDAPTFRHADRDRLFAMLQPFPKVLLLSAHTHNQRHFFHDAATGWHGARPLHEYNVGAACGAYWSGVPDASGIPASTMSDGTPNGYARLRIADGKVDARWFVARAPEGQQMTLHAPHVLRQGAYPAYGVFANVYMGQDDTPVQFRVDGGDWQAMKRVVAPDPALQDENFRDDHVERLRGIDRSPEAAPSLHLWRGALPTALPKGSHRVEVRAVIAGFGEAIEAIDYRLADSSGDDIGE